MPLPPLVEPVAALSDDERARTTRHTVLAGLGDIGQRRIAAAHVAVIGAGGLGSSAIQALAAAGVGTLTVIDDDVVEATNLQRQVIHRLADVGAAKVDSAARVTSELSETRVVPVRERLTAANAARLLDGAHVLIDGSDTFETREAVASACERGGIPLVWGTVQEFDAQVTVFWSAPPAPASPVRLADLYPPSSVGEVPTCAQVGVLGSLCQQVGALLATEAIKLIAGIGEPLFGRVLVIDALNARWREVPLRAVNRRSSSERSPRIEVEDRRSSSGRRLRIEVEDRRSSSGRSPRIETTAYGNGTGDGLDTAPAAPTRPTDAGAAPTRPAGAPAAPTRPTDAGAAPTRPADAGAAPSRPTDAGVPVPVVTAAELAGADVLDVREPDEIARTGLIPGARAIPLAVVLADPAAAAAGPVVVVCQVGMRAERAARALRDAGIEASVLAGGMAGWQRIPA